MGISIYYEARRPGGMSTPEQDAVGEVVRRYSVHDQIEEHHRTGSGWNGEDFCLYDTPFDSPDSILQGATRLPDEDEDIFWFAVQHWCRALSEIRRLLPDADWHVHVDDLDIFWDAERQEFDPERQPTPDGENSGPNS